MSKFNGLFCNLNTIHQLSDARSRSISAENFSGEKGQGGKATTGMTSEHAGALGTGWKVSPFVRIGGGETFTLADIQDSGAIQQIWMTPGGNWRFSILRIYWDDQEHPSVECPVGDFFASGWGKENVALLNSLAICVNPGSAFNCYWPMPFRKRCRITLENLDTQPVDVFYQINYALNEVPENAAYFHAQFRRVNPVPYKKVYTLLDGVQGQGHYVGTYIAWGVNNNGWWGEGEVKFYLDGDAVQGQPVAEETDDKENAAYATIVGTGTEDYFCGSFNFENQKTKQYQEFSTAYAGLPQVIRPDGVYQSQMRFGMYRWHLPDPVRFQEDIKVTIQALGWRPGNRFVPLQDDIASVAYWYQTLPTAPFPALPAKDYLEIA